MQVTYAKTSRAHEKEVKKSNDVLACMSILVIILKRIKTISNVVSIFYEKTITTQACNEQGEGGSLAYPFLRTEKKCPNFPKNYPDFGKMCPFRVHLWVKFSFKGQF